MNQTALVLLTAGLSVSLGHADDTLHQYLGSDVDSVFSVRSFSELNEQWESHPFKWIWEENFSDLIQDLQDAESVDSEDATPGFEAVLEDEFDLTLEELYELIPGQACLAVYNWVELIVGGTDAEAIESVEPDLVVMVEYAGDEDELARILDVQFHRNWDIQKEVNPLVEHRIIEETFMGETLYFDERFDGEDEVIEDGYALVDGIFILATPADRLRSTVEAIKEGIDQPLTEEHAYLRAQEEGGQGDVSAYFNLAAVMPELNELLMEASADSGMAMVGMTPKSLIDALALDALEGFFLNFDLEDDGALCSGGLIYSEKRGLLELLAYDLDGLPTASYVPESALTASLSSFNLSEMLASLERVLRVASPTMMPLFDMQLLQLKNSTGVDLRSALLDNFEGGLVSMSSIPERQGASELVDQPEQVLVIDIKDTEALSAALEALKDMAPMVKPMLKEQAYEGYTIYSFSDASGIEASEQVSYTLTRDKLLICIGRVGYLQAALSRLDSNTDGLWESPDVELMFDRIAQDNAVTRSYMDLSQYMNSMLQTVSEIMVLGDFLDGLDLDSMPTELGADLRMVSEVNEEPDGMFSRVLLVDLDAESSSQ